MKPKSTTSDVIEFGRIAAILRGKVAAPWVKQCDFRFIEGNPDFSGAIKDAPANAFSKLWIGDRVPRRSDMLSLMSMSDAFFGRVFHAGRELVPFGTVSLTRIASSIMLPEN